MGQKTLGKVLKALVATNVTVSDTLATLQVQAKCKEMAAI